jgi:hypothetical protein
MSSATLDRALALLIGLLLVSGLLTLRAGTPPTTPLFVVHGLIAGMLMAGLGLKLARSVPSAVRANRWGRLALAVAVTAVATAALAGGFAWVASGRILSVGPWTVLTLHVWAALALVPLVAVHLVPRRWRLLRPSSKARRGMQSVGSSATSPHLTRRSLLLWGGLGLVGLGAWAVTQLADVASGAQRRFTGSRALAAGGIPPVTTFYGDAAPRTDPAAWCLTVRGRVARELQLSTSDLAAMPSRNATATLDCTSGWAMTTDWGGVALAALLDAAGADSEARSVVVRSATGWATSLGMSEARDALLATHVAGRPLPEANGAPLRLVAPERRGLDWVKWVDLVEVV